METLNIGVDLEAIFQIEELDQMTYLKGILFSFIKRITELSPQIVEVIIFSTADPSISPFVFESLSLHELDVNQVIFTGGETLLPYLQALEVEIYLSVDQKAIHEAQLSGILAGFVSSKVHVSPLTIAFDHRLFLDDITYNGLGKWVPLLGYLQQQDKQFFSIELMTTRLYSVDRWVKELFQSSQCKINAICFIASGKGEDLLELFDVTIYFEGEKREPLSPLPTSDCILNIDF